MSVGELRHEGIYPLGGKVTGHNILRNPSRLMLITTEIDCLPSLIQGLGGRI